MSVNIYVCICVSQQFFSQSSERIILKFCIPLGHFTWQELMEDNFGESPPLSQGVSILTQFFAKSLLDFVLKVRQKDSS